MFSLWKVGVPVIVAAAVAIVWIGGVSMKGSNLPKVEQKIAVEEQKEGSDMISARDSSDTSLEADMMQVDASIEAYDKDQSAADDGLNDKPVSQTP